MKFFFTLLVFILAGIASVSASTDTIACTMEYAPVCGSVQVQCITAPCYPVRQTFSNSCMANASHATNITTGACDGSVITPPVIVGGDSDIHGCKASAGYSWNFLAKQCIRPWESRVRILTIAPEKQACTGVAPMECLQVRMGWQKIWQNFYNTIIGFDYLSGYSYRLLVLETKVDNPPADGSSHSYSLIRVLSKRSQPTENPLLGRWTLIGYNSTPITSTGYTLTIERDRLSAKFCNNMFGSYTLSGNTISSPGLASTMMYCEGQSMILENNFVLDGAIYSLQALRLMAGSTGPTMHLVITTKKGDIYTYGM
ncbi:DUF4377 domain-containing protein [Candidatus Gracilibacteria bacterium]|nr:DUF4377 domain-containing protein [Candidatus Gracilibacteria bacterium]